MAYFNDHYDQTPPAYGIFFSPLTLEASGGVLASMRPVLRFVLALVFYSKEPKKEPENP
jgi:hypothetical protein